MFTDMVGYTLLGQRNESLSLALVEEQRKVIRPILGRHNGREVNTIGDAFLVEFTNAIDAVRCAYDIQRAVREFNLGLSSERRIHLRIGIHVGEVVESQGDITGDAVNVASRIESLAEDGGVCLTRQVHDHVRNKVDLQLSSIGFKTLKNVLEPIEVYRMKMPWEDGPASQETRLETRRIAVLPFVSLSPDPNDEYFADGLTEELIDRLCQVGELEVIARTSVMSYKKKERKAAEIGRELRAGALVEGSIRKAGNKIRVTAQLINANTEGHLWSSKYDKSLEDIFAVQTDIAEQVAEALKVRLLPDEKRAIEHKPTGSTEAYTLYLKARYFWNERTEEGFRKAIAYLNQAIATDPNYALAYALLADAHSLLANYGLVQSKDSLPIALKFAESALRLDPTSSEVHDAMATVLWNEWKLRESLEESRKSIELNPNNATAHHRYAIGLALTGTGDGLHEIRKAKELDPLSPIINVAVGGALFALRRYEEAVRELEESLKLIPDYWNLFDYLGLALIKAGRQDEGISKLLKAVALSGHSDSVRADLAVGYALSGRMEEATRILDELIELTKRKYVSPVSLAAINAALRRNDEALRWLDAAHAERSGQLTYVLGDQIFLDALGSEPKFLALIREIRNG
jgi:TolB-like protein/Flp pilus assembly protein TadD